MAAANLREAVVVDAVRTPIARSGEKSVFKDIRADDLSVVALKGLLERTKVDTRIIEDVIWGCANQQGEQGVNIARNVGLLAGLPIETAGTSVDRQCGSSLQAINFAAYSVMTGNGDAFIAGGVEHMTHVSMGAGANPNMKLMEMFPPYFMFMGQTAEELASRFKITRQEADAFSLRSHQRAVAAQDSGRFKDEIIPVKVPAADGGTSLVTMDQHPRRDTSLEKLSTLRPSFKDDGIVTAGNSSGINDGASATLVMEKGLAKKLGYKPLAAVRATAVVGVPPEIMGIGPIPAIRKVLTRAGLTLKDIQLFEVNEAFACQVVHVAKELGINQDILNVNGGAVALGHPLGCSGARITATLLHEMKRRGLRWGVASLCIGIGQGIATVFEREA